jgi:hypothetical protein
MKTEETQHPQMNRALASYDRVINALRVRGPREIQIIGPYVTQNARALMVRVSTSVITIATAPSHLITSLYADVAEATDQLDYMAQAIENGTATQILTPVHQRFEKVEAEFDKLFNPITGNPT